MSEWHLSPDYIVTHWTDELFNLMVEKLTERKKGKPEDSTISAETLASQSRGLIKVVKN